jgi:hypothetical protein
LGRSRPGGRRARPLRATSADAADGGPAAGLAPAPSLASATLPRVWQGIGYRPLPDAAVARPLFDFAAVPWPAPRDLAFAWGAWTAGARGERLVAALVAERAGTAAFVHGPVIATDGDPVPPLEVAAQLTAAALDHASALGSVTVYARPQGLDRVWVRFGFIPVPESTLPAGLAGRPGAGLFAWRGGSALWTLREPAEP